MTFCLGWGVLMGFEEWRPAFDWKLKATLARTNGKSGWPRQWPSPYYLTLAKADPHSMYADRSPAGIWLTSWKDAWQVFKADPANKVEEPFADATSWAQHNAPDFVIYTRGVLALAAHLGVAQAREPYAFVDNMVKGTKYMKHKWAVAPGG